jgi:hypothetical protein
MSIIQFGHSLRCEPFPIARILISRQIGQNQPLLAIQTPSFLRERERIRKIVVLIIRNIYIVDNFMSLKS